MKYLLTRAKDQFELYKYSAPSNLPEGYNIFSEEIEYEDFYEEQCKQLFTFIEINSLEELEKFRNDVGGNIIIENSESLNSEFQTFNLKFEQIIIYDTCIE